MGDSSSKSVTGVNGSFLFGAFMLMVLFMIFVYFQIETRLVRNTEHSFLGGFWTREDGDTGITMYFSGDADKTGKFILSTVDGVDSEFEFSYSLKPKGRSGDYSISIDPIDNYSKYASLLKDDTDGLELHVDAGKLILYNKDETIAELLKDNKMMDMMLNCSID